jgi:hypothetical protein
VRRRPARRRPRRRGACWPADRAAWRPGGTAALVGRAHALPDRRGRSTASARRSRPERMVTCDLVFRLRAPARVGCRGCEARLPQGMTRRWACRSWSQRGAPRGAGRRAAPSGTCHGSRVAGRVRGCSLCRRTASRCGSGRRPAAGTDRPDDEGKRHCVPRTTRPRGRARTGVMGSGIAVAFARGRRGVTVIGRRQAFREACAAFAREDIAALHQAGPGCWSRATSWPACP